MRDLSFAVQPLNALITGILCNAWFQGAEEYLTRKK